MAIIDRRNAGGTGGGATPSQVAQINQNSADISNIEGEQIAQNSAINANTLGLPTKVDKPVGSTQGFVATVDATGNDIEYLAAPSGGGKPIATGNSLFVSPTGNDSNDGFSFGSPLATIDGLIDALYTYDWDAQNISVFWVDGTFDTGDSNTRRINAANITNFGSFEFGGDSFDPTVVFLIFNLEFIGFDTLTIHDFTFGETLGGGLRGLQFRDINQLSAYDTTVFRNSTQLILNNVAQASLQVFRFEAIVLTTDVVIVENSRITYFDLDSTSTVTLNNANASFLRANRSFVQYANTTERFAVAGTGRAYELADNSLLVNSPHVGGSNPNSLDNTSTIDSEIITNPYVVVNSTGNVPTVANTDGIGIGVDAGVFGDDGIAIGNSAVVFAASGFQIGTGTNATANTFQFLTNRLANAEGLYTSFTAPVNYTPADTDNVTSHFQAIDSVLSKQETVAAEVSAAAVSSVIFSLLPVDSTSNAVLVAPISTPVAGDWFEVVDSREQASTNNITVDFVTATQNLYATSQNYVISLDGERVKFTYINATIGWVHD